MNAMMLKEYRIRPDRSVEEKGKGKIKEQKERYQQENRVYSKQDCNNGLDCRGKLRLQL